MQEFCPMCFESGIKAKLRTYQINFEEAVVMCESKQVIKSCIIILKNFTPQICAIS